MSTTTLYAELIVVGSGALISILLLFYSLFGDSSWFGKLDGLSSIESVISLVPVLSVIYLLGIVITGVGYLLFKRPEKSMRKTKLSGGKSEYSEIRNTLYTSSDVKDLIEAFEFRRSKIRICRGWFINSTLIIVALFTCLWNAKIQHTVVWFFIIADGLLMIGTVVIWWVATDNELDWLKSYADTKVKDPNPK